MPHKLGELLRMIGADLMEEPQTGIALSPECWATDLLVLTEEQQNSLIAEVDAFLTFLE